MRFIKLTSIATALLLVTFLPGSARAQTQNSRPAQPGAINYVEGQASIGNEQVTPDSVGSVALQAGQTLDTQSGKVEVLLTPGVFLRLDDNSSVKMINSGLANTEVQIDKGTAMIEATDISKNNHIEIHQEGATAKILKNGLYEFDTNQHAIRVFKGKAQVVENDKKIDLGKERQLIVNAAGKPKAQSFDTRNYENDFFRWSALRSGYLSEASVDQARMYVNGGPGWLGTGWYWDPWFDCYTFIPAGGVFYSPFGWGFYSPIVVYRSPFFYGGYRGFGHPHPFNTFHYPYGHGFEPLGGFHGPVGGFHGGRFGGARGGVGGRR
jgi:hypothetical protein